MFIALLTIAGNDKDDYDGDGNGDGTVASDVDVDVDGNDYGNDICRTAQGNVNNDVYNDN